MKIEVLPVGQLRANCYLVYDNKGKCFIIDPGDDAEFIINRIKDLDLLPKAVLATHGHFDHVLGAVELQLGFNVPFYIHKQDASLVKRASKTAKFFLGTNLGPSPEPDGFFSQEELNLSDFKLQVLHTPGHTPGGVSFYCVKQSLVFVGDLLFAQGGYGRTDLAGGNYMLLQKSIKKILSLPDQTIIYPGHGEVTSVGQEKEFWNNNNQDLLV